MAERKGSAIWKGDLEEGTGNLTVGEGVFSGRYSFSSRFEEGEGTNPEELLGAAHAACFSMALSGDLAEHGHEVESVSTTATVRLRTSEAGPAIDRIELVTEGRVAGIDEDHFREHAEGAKQNCPVSQALAAVGEITVEAKLV